MPLFDPYRPTTFDEIVGQPTDKIAALLDGFNTPNFLFYGPPGTGKTSAAKVIARELQGGGTGELMEFNASDDRGIDTVRQEIIPAARQSTISGHPRVIFLDEMDSMTHDAQQALRQPMEQTDAVFVLACNDREAVHDAVVDRCRAYEFGRVPTPAIKERIRQIADTEGVDLDESHVKSIAASADGSVRSAIFNYEDVLAGISETRDVQTDGNTLESKAAQFLGDD